MEPDQRPDFHQVSLVTQPATRRSPRDRQGRPQKGEAPKWVEAWLLREQEERLGYFVLYKNP